MLKIYFGDMEESIYDPSTYFDNTFEEDWITQPLVKEIIKDIDKSEVINSRCIQSPVLGQIPPITLSGGTKTLILMINDDSEVFNASACGDNCAKWILRIGEQKDLTINLRHIMGFGNEKFSIEIANCNKIVHNMKELLPYASKYLRE